MTSGPERQPSMRVPSTLKMGQPGRMGRPGRGRHEIAIGYRVGNADVGEGASGYRDFGTHSRIGRDCAALHHTGGGEDLRAVADRAHRLAGREEMAHDVQHAFVEAQVFRGPTPEMTSAS